MENFKYKNTETERPTFPKRAVVTAGMPYGNKELHFGHIGGVFVHADTYARFLRDRIGEENVIFVSGTDCYGSPILESYRKLTAEDKFQGTMEEYVELNHQKQKEALDRYEISLNLYAASALGKAGEIHKKVSKEVFDTLYKHGYLEKMSTPQFFDPDFQVLLNGRQVVGKCPIEGCQSEGGYADECSLGHQYMPSDLIDPKSTLSGKTPLVKEVSNWYFILDQCGDMLTERMEYLRKHSNERKYLLNTIEEFLKPPVIYVQKKQINDLERMITLLPKHQLINEEKKPSYTFIFEDLESRDKAREVFGREGVHLRTGKTLVPFRLSGNIEWGVPVPDKEGMYNLTFWVWPESLWAPISFTRAYLESIGGKEEDWKKFWFHEEAEVYQFIGEDNIYFYGVAEMAMFTGLFCEAGSKPDMTKLKLPKLIANNHILFMDKKASSSSEIKPPMAAELLDYYTAEQLRIHFLSLGLANKSVSFMPQVYMEKEKQVGVDTVLKEGNLLTNVFNRLIRSCFYTAQTYFDSILPKGDVSEEILNASKEAILTYERHMYRYEFHSITYVLDSYLRNMNKYWAAQIRIAETTNNQEIRAQVLIDCLHVVRTATTLLHPIAPKGCEMIQEYLNVGKEIFRWDHIFLTLNELVNQNELLKKTAAKNIKEIVRKDNKEISRKDDNKDKEVIKKIHRLRFLEPRIDFFKKHKSQFMEKEE